MNIDSIRYNARKKVILLSIKQNFYNVSKQIIPSDGTIEHIYSNITIILL